MLIIFMIHVEISAYLKQQKAVFFKVECKFRLFVLILLQFLSIYCSNLNLSLNDTHSPVIDVVPIMNGHVQLFMLNRHKLWIDFVEILIDLSLWFINLDNFVLSNSQQVSLHFLVLLSRYFFFFFALRIVGNLIWLGHYKQLFISLEKIEFYRRKRVFCILVIVRKHVFPTKR